MKYNIVFAILVGLLVSCQNSTMNNDELQEANYQAVSNDTTLREYFKDGSVKKILHTKDGLLDGVSIEYYLDGGVKKEANFKQDKLHGEVRFFDETGNLREVRNYKDGIQEGVSSFYFKSGKLSTEEIYRNGKKEGLTIAYHPNGELFLKEVRKDGMRNGSYQVYYEDGKTLEEAGQYKDDERDGLFVSFYKNGIVKDSIIYDLGLFVEAHTYDSNGVYIESLYPKKE